MSNVLLSAVIYAALAAAAPAAFPRPAGEDAMAGPSGMSALSMAMPTPAMSVNFPVSLPAFTPFGLPLLTPLSFPLPTGFPTPAAGNMDSFPTTLMKVKRGENGLSELLTMFPTPSANLPTMFPTPSANLLTMFPTPSVNLLTMFPTPSANLLTMFPTPSVNLLTMFPTPSVNLLTMFPTPSALSGMSGLSSSEGTGSSEGSSNLISRDTSDEASLRDSIENGLEGACKAATLIFARGIAGLGNMGSTIGPSLASNLGKAIGVQNLTVQGVDYAADMADIAAELKGDGAGTRSMVAYVKKAASKCPETEIILAGYSLGAMVVHNTGKLLNKTEAAFVKAAITFADPLIHEAENIGNITATKFKTFCDHVDPICAFGGNSSAIAESNLNYSTYAPAAVKFVNGLLSRA